jgi:hypothetical protein
MARRFLLVLLALGSVAGFAAGFRAWQFHHEYGWGPPWAMHDGWMHEGRMHEGRLDAVAEACVRAAERVHGAANSPGANAPAASAPAGSPPAP